jgi:hypothetical protein
MYFYTEYPIRQFIINCYYLHYKTNSYITVSLFPAVWIAATIVEFPTIVQTQTILGFKWGLGAKLTGQRTAPEMETEKNLPQWEINPSCLHKR